jgi:hypothetical protein
VVPGHGAKPQISVTIDFNDLAAATANATGALVFGDDLSAATVRRLACDAEILPIILGTKSQPLDVGTTQRLVTRPIRRALNARDKGCVICGAPPSQTEAHHIIHWANGGPTAITNLALLCKRHHIDLHSGHYQIHILNDTVHITRPTWTNPTHTPPGKYQPPTANITHQPPTHFDPWGDDDPPASPTAPTPSIPINPWGEDHAPTRPTGPTAPTLENPRVEDASPTPTDSPAPPTAPGPWDDNILTPPTAPIATRLPILMDPWGEGDTPTPPVGLKPSIPANPWGEHEPPTSPPPPTGTRPPISRDPWGDEAAGSPSSAPLALVTDPCGDGSPAATATKPLIPFDPWSDNAQRLG